jgi:hypothetical protein
VFFKLLLHLVAEIGAKINIIGWLVLFNSWVDLISFNIRGLNKKLRQMSAIFYEALLILRIMFIVSHPERTQLFGN